MFSSRVVARSLRLANKPTSFFTASTLNNATKNVSRRAVTTESMTNSGAMDILNSQRVKRPISPHLTIYQPQVTWVLSSLNRITAVALSGGMYLYAMAYITGLTDSARLSAWMKRRSGATKALIKGVVAVPFSFHFWNGIRHLVWDSTKELSVKGVYRTGYAVMGLTVVSTLGLIAI